MSSLKQQALYMVFIGVFAFVMSSSMNVTCALFGENVAFKTRVRYFTTCIEKDAAFYDENVPTTMASRISKECTAIQKGVGEKIANIVYQISGFILGFAFSFYWGWLYTCILLGILPFAGVAGAFMGAMFEQGMVENMKAYT